MSAAMGAATVPVIYLAASPVFGPVAALVSSAIVTVSFIHVRDSKFAKTEVPAGLWLALSILMVLRISVRGRSMDYALAGFFCGLAAATHYPSGAIAVGIVVAHLEVRRREGESLLGSLADTRIYLAGIVTLITFLCADPYFVLDWKATVNTYHNMQDAYKLWNRGHTPAGFGWPWLLLLAMPASFGIALELFLLSALPWVIFRPKPGTYALMAFILVCFLSLTNGRPQLEFRYLINPLLAMALLGGVFAADLKALACSSMETRAGNLVALLGGILLLAPSLIRDVQLNRLLRLPDTRTIARMWMLNRIPPGSTIAMVDGDGYGKPKLSSGYREISVNSSESLRSETETAKWVVADSFPLLSLWSKGVTDSELAELTSEGTLELDIDPIKAGAEAPTFDPNDAFYVPFTHITSMLRPGPRIRIWKITGNSASRSDD